MIEHFWTDPQGNPFAFPFSRKFFRTFLLAMMLAGGMPVSVVAQESNAEDAFDREVRFINHLMASEMFGYATLALEELRYQYPDQQNRVEVVEAGMKLRLGKTDEVEKLLSTRDLATDMKAQAIFLNLAMTYDGMGNEEKAMETYRKFLRLNEGREITDPDVVRLFASAGLRLATILSEQGEFNEADKVLRVVIESSDEPVIQRIFSVKAAQNQIDKALTLSGSAKSSALEAAEKYTKTILWGGANDNYGYMAMGLRAWITYERGSLEDAVAMLKKVKGRARDLEDELDKRGDVPKSEYPRALLRYVEGLIQFDLAKKAVAGNDLEGGKTFAQQAAGNFYNAFLKYDRNEYGSRSALKFQEVKNWIEDVYDVVIEANIDSPELQRLIFKRELDLAAKLADNEKWTEAETAILDALNQYPTTPYTLGALETLSTVWMGMEDRDLELLSIVEYLAQLKAQLPDNPTPIRVTRRIAKYMDDRKDVFGSEVALGTLARFYPEDPNAPLFLYRLGKAAADRGEAKKAMDFYNEVIELYPESSIALNVLRLQGEEAMNSGNYEASVALYERVKERAPEGSQRVNAMYQIADAKLRMQEKEQMMAGLEELQALKQELAPRPGSRYYEGDLAEKSSVMLEKVEFRIGYELLLQASQSKDDELRTKAADALNSFLTSYPDSPNAPQVMFNLGRLYLQQGQFDQATRVFNDLARKYADHPLGKDALYSLVKAALEENQVEVAQEAVQKMVASPDTYGPQKMFRVGSLMLENERYIEAMDSFDLVLANADDEDSTLKQRTLLQIGQAGLGAGGEQLDRGAKALEQLIDEFQTSRLVLDAGLALSEIYLKKEPPQPDKAERALAEATRILAARPDMVLRNKIGIALGHVLMAQENPKAALTKWYGVALFKPENDEERATVREAMLLAITEAQEQAKQDDSNWAIVEELARLFVEYLPMDTKSGDMVLLEARAASLKPQTN